MGKTAADTNLRTIDMEITSLMKYALSKRAIHKLLCTVSALLTLELNSVTFLQQFCALLLFI
jgi:hypothetical protein